MTRYLSKRPCANGHTGERYIHNNRCLACNRNVRSKYRARQRDRAIAAVEKYVGKTGCHYKIHPNMPEELKKRKCWGKLTFEHPNGGGSKNRESGRQAIDAILSGDAHRFLILCQLHQCWNFTSFGTEDKWSSSDT